MGALKQGGLLPERAQWEILAQHWHCTPAEAREQTEEDVAIAKAYLAAVAEVNRQREYFGH